MAQTGFIAHQYPALGAVCTPDCCKTDSGCPAAAFICTSRLMLEPAGNGLSRPFRRAGGLGDGVLFSLLYRKNFRSMICCAGRQMARKISMPPKSARAISGYINHTAKRATSKVI